MQRRTGKFSQRDRFDIFTERARHVLRLAQEEAQRFRHNYIGTEHLLLGLIGEGDGVAARVLRRMGVDLDEVRRNVEAIIGRGKHRVPGEVGLTPRAKKVIALAEEEAARLRHHYIGTEHLLLGLIREGEGIGARVLESSGIKLNRARREVEKELDSFYARSTTHNRQKRIAMVAGATVAAIITAIALRRRIFRP